MEPLKCFELLRTCFLSKVPPWPVQSHLHLSLWFWAILSMTLLTSFSNVWALPRLCAQFPFGLLRTFKEQFVLVFILPLHQSRSSHQMMSFCYDQLHQILRLRLLPRPHPLQDLRLALLQHRLHFLLLQFHPRILLRHLHQIQIDA